MKLILSISMLLLSFNILAAEFCYKKFLYIDSQKTMDSKIFCFDKELSMAKYKTKNLDMKMFTNPMIIEKSLQGELIKCTEGYYTSQYCEYTATEQNFTMIYLKRRSCDILKRTSNFSCIGIQINGNQYF